MENLIQILRRLRSSTKAHLYLFILLLPILLPGPPSYAKEDAKAWYNEGLAMYESGKYQEALNCFDKALEIDPKLALAWNGKGAALDSLGRYQEAINCYDKALEINPENPLVWDAKGWSLGALGKYDLAFASPPLQTDSISGFWKGRYTEVWKSHDNSIHKGVLAFELEVTGEEVTGYVYEKDDESMFEDDILVDLIPIERGTWANGRLEIKLGEMNFTAEIINNNLVGTYRYYWVNEAGNRYEDWEGSFELTR